MLLGGSSVRGLIWGMLLVGIYGISNTAVFAAANGNGTLVPQPALKYDVLVCAVSSHDNVALTFPGDWTIEREGNNTAALRATLAWKRYAADDPAPATVTVTHPAGDGIVGRARLFRGCVRTGSPIAASSIRHNAASSTCTADSITPGFDECLIVFTMHDSDDGLSSVQRLSGVTNMAEVFDSTSTLGLDEAVSMAEFWQEFDAATGNATGTLSLGPDVNTGILFALKPQLGLTQPGGPGNKIYEYDDASSVSGLGFTDAERSAFAPAEVIALGTTPETYRYLVGIQEGDDRTGAKITTHITIGQDVKWDDGKGLSVRDPQIGAFNSVFDGADVNLGAASNLEALPIINKSRIVVRDGLLPIGSGQIFDSEIRHLGTSATSGFFIYQCTLENVNLIAALTTGPMVTSLDVFASSRKVKYIGDPTYYFDVTSTLLNAPSEGEFSGTPSVADVNVSVVPLQWRFTKQKWSGNAPKFSFLVEVPLGATDGAITEIRGYDMKLVDPLGAPVSGKSARLVDDLGNEFANVLTDSEGRMVFTYIDPLGLFQNPANTVYVLDHGSDAALNALTRARKFTLHVNHPSDPSYDPTLETIEEPFEWPGVDDGVLEDVIMVVTIRTPVSTSLLYANFGATPGGGTPPLTVQFTDESVQGAGPIISWAWDFGDGTTSTDQNPVHTYSSPGAYTVALTVGDGVGQAVRTHVQMINVVDGKPTRRTYVPYPRVRPRQGPTAGGDF